MSHDVVIAGAGPNGLMLACELALAGVRPVVLERLTGPSGEQRANGMVGQVVRMLDRRGLHERLTGDPQPPRPAPGFMFAAFGLDLARLADNPMYLMHVQQPRIEQMLAERATELGVEVRRGHQLTGLTQSPCAVTVEIEGPDGPYRLETAFLVGADGGRSLTRKLTGIDFPGVTTDDVISRNGPVSVPAELIDPVTGGLVVAGHGVIPPTRHYRTEQGLFVFASLPGRPPMVVTMERRTPASEAPADGGPLTLAELREAVGRVLGVDVPIGPAQGDGPHPMRRRTAGNTRLADSYRQGRVLLVGDAAHVHSAIGGPGLNLGLQDAINLGWKLAAELAGWAPAGLLDSYQAERRPAGQRVTMHTQAQSALVGPGPEITALRELFGELLQDPHTVQHLADLMSGADLRYEMGVTGHPLIGRWAPDLVLETGSGDPVRLAELTRTARPLLLDLTDDGRTADVAAPWKDRVDVVPARIHQGGPTDVTALLLRPDCYVAWATAAARPDDADHASLRFALTRWFGADR